MAFSYSEEQQMLQQSVSKFISQDYDWDCCQAISKSAIAAGADGLFIETHPDPSKALSDGANMLHLDNLESLLTRLVHLKKAVNSCPA
mgnify:CR=1 FL=1